MAPHWSLGKKLKTMKEPSLYELIGSLRNQTGSLKLNKQYIVDFAVDNFSKLLNTAAVIKVCQILIEIFFDGHSLDDNLQSAIEDYLELNQ